MAVSVTVGHAQAPIHCASTLRPGTERLPGMFSQKTQLDLPIRQLCLFPRLNIDYERAGHRILGSKDQHWTCDPKLLTNLRISSKVNTVLSSISLTLSISFPVYV